MDSEERLRAGSTAAPGAIPALRQAVPSWETVVIELAWQIPLGVFGSIVLARLFLSPYWMHKEKQTEVAELLERSEALQRQLDTAVSGDVRIWADSRRFGYIERYKPKDPTAVVLWMLVHWNALLPVRLEGIVLELLGERYRSDYDPMSTAEAGHLSTGAYFELPSSLKAGTYTVRIMASFDGDEREVPSKEFSVIYQPQDAHTEGSQRQ
jgi:hypothetical protein